MWQGADLPPMCQVV